MKNKKKSKKKVYKLLTELEKSRTGGQIALAGFTYQFLYSCYLILSECDEGVKFSLEGLEDIDQYKCNVTSESDKITHIQLKYSQKKQDASFLKDILKNYLEVYLIDKTRYFKLVYDFNVSKGNLNKLINKNLDEKSKKYWTQKVENIKNENNIWNWSDFSIDDFFDKITFEKWDKENLSLEIEKILIDKYNIITGNIQLYANGIKVCCLEKMESRESIDKKEVDVIIQNINDDISKGIQNPAHNWIKKITFDDSKSIDDKSYFEGKKATPQDIALNLPVRRTETEKEVEDSIKNNTVTVIKASSGQGKTTIALQVACNLFNEYSIYQLKWCNDAKELNNIIQYFDSRVKLGEKILIIIDNLDVQLSEWNRLAQLLQEEVIHNYKLLLTSREDDWYSYSGNLSNVKSLKIVKLSLNKQDAKAIFMQLKKRKLLHRSITEWEHSWQKIEGKKLLIEYVYLITHGEMISERINQQIALISKSKNGKIKCEMLRSICFADICGIRLSVKDLIHNLKETTSSDYGELLKSVKNEFLISIEENGKFIEGLHPVRSMHIVEKLHEYYDINDTAINVIKTTNLNYLSKLFSNLPKWITNRDVIYDDIVKVLWNPKSLSVYVMALKGLLSGSINLYFFDNQEVFDDANNRGGLMLISTELNPFTSSLGFNYKLDILNDFKNSFPGSKNIKYLSNLKENAGNFDLMNTDLFVFSKALFGFLLDKDPLIDIGSYALISYWLLNVNKKFNLSKQIVLNEVWENKDKYNVEIISNVMHTCFCGDREVYLSFVNANFENILIYLKHTTNSLKIFVDDDKSKINIEYALMMSNIKDANEESVNRIKLVCKILPIYKTYCADSISPQSEMLSGYDIPNDAYKKMPIENVVPMFNQDFSSIWSNTIMSNYESDSVLEWVNYWINLRNDIICLFNLCEMILHKLLAKKLLGNSANIFDNLRFELDEKLKREIGYPNQYKPFEEKAVIISKFKKDYFINIKNFINQVVNFIRLENEESRLAIINLLWAKKNQFEMQEFFKHIINNQDLSIDGYEQLCELEKKSLSSLIMTCEYYVSNKPNEYFNKYSVELWHNKRKKQLINDSREALKELEENYDVIFPVNYYLEGLLKHYPIIVNDLKFEDAQELIKFLGFCTDIISIDYNYVVIAFISEINQVNSKGLKVSYKFLKDLRNAIDKDDDNMMNNLESPFPEKISTKFLKCFKEDLNLVEFPILLYEGIDIIFELLWCYSISRDILVDKYDSKYLSHILVEYENKITDLIKEFEGRIPEKEYAYIIKICTDVYDGKSFGDAELNYEIERLMVLINKSL